MLNEKEIKERARRLLDWVQKTKEAMELRAAAYKLKIKREQERKGVANYE